MRQLGRAVIRTLIQAAVLMAAATIIYALLLLLLGRPET